jgi:hypothetical protein
MASTLGVGLSKYKPSSSGLYPSIYRELVAIYTIGTTTGLRINYTSEIDAYFNFVNDSSRQYNLFTPESLKPAF